MRILLSNDDGLHADGLKILHQHLQKIADVFVIAPLEEKSTTGHSLTLHKPLRLTRTGSRSWGCNGTPADCVYLGMREVLRGKKPDLIVSGINRGANLGQDIYYSGTVSAAREGSMAGVPALAVSLALDQRKKRIDEKKLHYKTAGQLAIKVIQRLKGIAMPKHTLVNLNVPDRPASKIKGITLARQGFRFYGGQLLRREDHRGKTYYWVGGQYQGYKKSSNTDCLLVDKGFAVVTPMQLDTTDYDFMDVLQGVV